MHLGFTRISRRVKLISGRVVKSKMIKTVNIIFRFQAYYAHLKRRFLNNMPI